MANKQLTFDNQPGYSRRRNGGNRLATTMTSVLIMGLSHTAVANVPGPTSPQRRAFLLSGGADALAGPRHRTENLSKQELEDFDAGFDHRQHVEHTSAMIEPTMKRSFVDRILHRDHEMASAEEVIEVTPSVSQVPAPTIKQTGEYRGALIRTGFTVAAAGLFGFFLMATRGSSSAYEFFAGYLVEQSLSIDNLFVFIMLFDYFRVPSELQNRVLSWGITGAVALRGLMIGVGVAAIQRFKSVILLFAGILIASSLKLLTEKDDHGDEIGEDNFIMKLTSWLFPNTSKDYHGDAFFAFSSETGKRIATPLFMCLLCVELSDFVFAVDSIPAVLGVSKDPIVVYASNIFAIAALRSLYTVLNKAVADLHYLKPAVALVLGFVGSKMIAEYFHVEVGTGTSLAVVGSLLAGGVLASLVENRVKNRGDTIPTVTVSTPSMANITAALFERDV